jgi:uncharacterized repeat protein (TIGR01451 family)
LTVAATAISLGFATNNAIETNSQVDPNFLNNTAQVVTAVLSPDMAIGLTGSPSLVTVGQPVVYTLSVTNLGPVRADGVLVTNTLAPNFSFTTAVNPGGTYTNVQNAVVFQLGSMTNGQTVILTVVASATGLGQATNAAVVSDAQVDSNTTNNTAMVVTSVVAPDLGIGMTVSPASLAVGQLVTYRLTVSNLGPVDAAGVIVTNTLLSNLSLAGVSLPLGISYSNYQNTVYFNIGTMTNGQVISAAVLATTLAAGKGTNTAIVGGNLPDNVPANNSAKAITTITSGSSQFTGVTVVPGVTSAFITWNTASNSSSQVDYGLTAAASVSWLNSTPTNHHVVLLTGLLPDSAYVFQVRSVTPAIPFSQTTNGPVVTTLNGAPSFLYVTNGTFATTSTLIFGTADASYSGDGWTVGSSAGGIFTGPNNNEPYYQYAPGVSVSPTASAAYVPNIPVAGLYDISVWYPINPGSFSSSTPMIASGATNAVLVEVDQTANGGGWNQIVAGLYFATGTGGNLTIYNNSGSQGASVAANGVRFVYETNQDASTNGNVPAWWANFYFGHAVTGSSDPDGDGYSSYAEYVLGTDPTSLSSQLQFQVTPASTTNVAVTFAPWQGGRLYQLQSSPSLLTPSWVTLTNTAAQNTNDGSGTFTVRESRTNLFYRLSATLLPNQ